jgi:hypothetical protein
MRSFFMCCALIGASAVHAEDATGEFAIKGAGLQTCAGLTQAWDNKTSDIALYLGWIDGYMTGMNQYQPETFDVAPWQTSTTLLGLTKRLCDQSDKNARIMDVFNKLMTDFRPARLREKTDATALTTEGQAVVLYTETVVRLQRRLADEGFDPITRNGTLDQATLDALTAFQADRGMPETGLPDQNTLFALFVQNKSAE